MPVDFHGFEFVNLADLRAQAAAEPRFTCKCTGSGPRNSVREEYTTDRAAEAGQWLMDKINEYLLIPGTTLEPIDSFGCRLIENGKPTVAFSVFDMRPNGKYPTWATLAELADNGAVYTNIWPKGGRK